METLKQLLETVYRSIAKRRDSYLELGLALARASQVESGVALSASPLYGGKFSSVYERLKQVELDEAVLLKANLELFGAECDELEGVEIYSGDSRFSKRSEAKTLEGRVMKGLSSGEWV